MQTNTGRQQKQRELELEHPKSNILASFWRIQFNKKCMDDSDIQTLVKILNHKKRNDLSSLLKNCLSEIEQSGQFGSRWNSIISTFLIYAPVEDYYKLKNLSKADQKFIFDSIIDIYPIADGSEEITSTEFRILKEGEYENQELATYVGRTVRVFLSYSTFTQENKEFTGNIKRELEKLGLEVFLAHEDINPSSDWQEAILENLKSTDIFMPIINDDFHKSFWTDQESGIAFSDKKFIIPIAVDGHMPYGFLGKFQAFRTKSDLPIDVCKIMEAIIQGNPGFSSPLLDSLIKSFANSYKYDDAGSKSILLLKFNTMSAEQANEIFRSVLQNDQIYDSRSANKNINTLFKKYKHLLDKKLVERLKEQDGLLDADIHNELQTAGLEKSEKIKLMDMPF